MPLTPTPESIEEVLPSGGENQSDGVFNSFRIPVLGDEFLAISEAQGEPFYRNGPMPGQIIASTFECHLVSIDTSTGQPALIWDYSGVDKRRSYCDTAKEEEPPADLEAPSSSIEDLEWINSSLLLIGLCCEPAVGRFEAIDTSVGNRPYWVALNGGSPSVNGNNVLAFSLPSLFRSNPNAIGSVPFEVRFDDSDPDRPFFSVQSDTTFYSLYFSPEEDASVRGAVSQLSWVGDNKIAFELWTIGVYPEPYPFIGIIDIQAQSIAFKSRGGGWTRPSGDSVGNLAAVEDGCRIWIDTCDTNEAKIVVLDSETLMPLHETSLDDNIADMDLSRGWLLVTFSNGQMGSLDLADGTFTSIADGIVNAIWAE